MTKNFLIKIFILTLIFGSGVFLWDHHFQDKAINSEYSYYVVDKNVDKASPENFKLTYKLEETTVKRVTIWPHFCDKN